MRTKAVAGLGVLGLLALGLSACSSMLPSSPVNLPDYEEPTRGQHRVEVEGKLNSITGIDSASLAGGDAPNVKGNTGYAVDFKLEEGYRLAAPVSLIEYTLKSVWSINDGEQPNAQISITVRGPEGSELDLPAAAELTGWIEDADSEPGSSSTVIIELDGSQIGQENLERLGTWPGHEPGLPLDILIPED